MIIRMKSGACFDPAIGRFLFWPFDGPVIPDRLVHRVIDMNRYPSLEQFVLVLSFIENVTFAFDPEAIQEIVTWGNTSKQKSMCFELIKSSRKVLSSGFEIRNSNECLSARLGKSIQHVYRMAAFLETIEIGFALCEDYLGNHGHFPDEGAVSTQFINDVQLLFQLKYDPQSCSQSSFSIHISKNVVLRAIDLIACNMRQFAMLFDSTNAPKVSAIGRQIVVVSPEQNQSNSSSSSSVVQSKRVDSKRKFCVSLRQRVKLNCQHIHVMK
jgi:hypothetical protein